jgi:hypothetical protein
MTPELYAAIVAAIEATLAASGVTVTDIVFENGQVRVLTQMSGPAGELVQSSLSTLLASSETAIITALSKTDSSLSKVQIFFISIMIACHVCMYVHKSPAFQVEASVGSTQTSTLALNIEGVTELTPSLMTLILQSLEALLGTSGVVVTDVYFVNGKIQVDFTLSSALPLSPSTLQIFLAEKTSSIITSITSADTSLAGKVTATVVEPPVSSYLYFSATDITVVTPSLIESIQAAIAALFPGGSVSVTNVQIIDNVIIVELSSSSVTSTSNFATLVNSKVSEFSAAISKVDATIVATSVSCAEPQTATAVLAFNIGNFSGNKTELQEALTDALLAKLKKAYPDISITSIVIVGDQVLIAIQATGPNFTSSALQDGATIVAEAIASQIDGIKSVQVESVYSVLYFDVSLLSPPVTSISFEMYAALKSSIDALLQKDGVTVLDIVIEDGKIKVITQLVGLPEVATTAALDILLQHKSADILAAVSSYPGLGKIEPLQGYYRESVLFIGVPGFSTQLFTAVTSSVSAAFLGYDVSIGDLSIVNIPISVAVVLTTFTTDSDPKSLDALVESKISAIIKSLVALDSSLAGKVTAVVKPNTISYIYLTLGTGTKTNNFLRTYNLTKV